MLHARALNKIGSVVSVLKKFQIGPFEWNSDNTSLCYITTIRRQLIFYLTVFLMTSNVIYLGNQLNIAISKPKIDISALLWIGIFLVGFCAGILSVSGIESKKAEICGLFNQSVKFFRRICDTKVESESDLLNLTENNLLIHIINVFSVLVNCTCVALTIIFVMMSSEGCFIYSQLQHLSSSNVLYVLAGAYETLIRYILISSIMLQNVVFLGSVSFFQGSLSLIHFHMPVLLGMFGFFTIVGICGSIRLRNEVEAVEYLILLECGFVTSAVVFVYLHFSGRLLQTCIICIQSMRKDQKNVSVKLSNKIMRTLQPFGVKIGTVRAAGYAALVGFFVTVMNISVSLLVSFPRV